MTEADGHWLAGLVDGEGCFHLTTDRTRSVRGRGRRYRVLNFAFTLALRLDDRATLEQARKILGVGNIGVNRRGRGPATSPNAKPLAGLIVQKHDDLRHVVEFFRAYPLRSKKARDFAIWSRALDRFAAAIAATPLLSLSKGAIKRPTIKGVRRRPEGTARTRFRVIPDSLFEEMRGYAADLRRVREYR